MAKINQLVGELRDAEDKLAKAKEMVGKRQEEVAQKEQELLVAVKSGASEAKFTPRPKKKGVKAKAKTKTTAKTTAKKGSKQTWKDFILDLLVDEKTWYSAEIEKKAAAKGWKKSNVAGVLAQLLKSGHIKRTGIGQYQKASAAKKSS